MSVKILSRRSNYLERAIIFEVDGEIKNVSAPRSAKSFDDLLKQIETEYGAVDAAGADAIKSASEPAAVKPVVEEPAAVVEPAPATETPAETTAAATTTKKTTTKKKSTKS